jgi:CDP-diacylglycerol--glycerol-3-phosphate 3-phosphatidyltransferase
MENLPQNEKNKKPRFKGKITHKIEEKIDIKRLLFRVFDEPRPEYIAKITLTDRILDVTILWLFPEWVRPNYVTIFRLLSIPFIIWLLAVGRYDAATILFAVAAISDAVDGAIARTRNKITDWGIVFDPLTDKLLIGIIGGMLIYRFVSHLLAIEIIFVELLLVFSAYYRFKGRVVPAKTAGKIKMILESVGIGFIFLFLLTNAGWLLIAAQYTLYLAILFALASLLIYRSI